MMPANKFEYCPCGKIECTLFGDFADQIKCFIEPGNIHPPVIVLLYAKVKLYKGVFVVFATIAHVIHDDNWWYPACKCHKSVTADNDMYYCSACRKHVFSVIPRFRVKFEALDDSGVANLVMFDYDVAYLLKKTCSELLAGLKEVEPALHYLSYASEESLGGWVPDEFEALVGKKLLFKVTKNTSLVSTFGDTYRGGWGLPANKFGVALCNCSSIAIMESENIYRNNARLARLRRGASASRKKRMSERIQINKCSPATPQDIAIRSRAPLSRRRLGNNFSSSSAFQTDQFKLIRGSCYRNSLYSTVIGSGDGCVRSPMFFPASMRVKIKVFNRMRSFRNDAISTSLDESLVQDLINMIDEYNVLAKSFRRVRDHYASNYVVPMSLRLFRHQSNDAHIYNLPSVDEVAALIVGDFES
ncbi:hypothetical protein RIF29_28865 [Crotalaria pallida]|uniref:Replication factor A C-terminal domain-containing protein n=1 Tax=Crotalaria pallida TaxID=3830 RepID=A0AAN9EFM8_CROPI